MWGLRWRWCACKVNISFLATVLSHSLRSLSLLHSSTSLWISVSLSLTGFQSSFPLAHLYTIFCFATLLQGWSQATLDWVWVCEPKCTILSLDCFSGVLFHRCVVLIHSNWRKQGKKLLNKCDTFLILSYSAYKTKIAMK